VIADLEQRLVLQQNVRTKIVLFIDKSQHYRESGEYSIWKIGFRNDMESVPVEGPAVKIMDIVPEGRGKSALVASANEVKGMYLLQTHRQAQGGAAIVTEHCFDFVQSRKSEEFVSVMHDTRRADNGEPNTSLGKLSKGKYRVTLRAEARNADHYDLVVLLDWKREKLVVEAFKYS
jgi:hypothetical protein